jgi:hypothetical protein
MSNLNIHLFESSPHDRSLSTQKWRQIKKKKIRLVQMLMSSSNGNLLRLASGTMGLSPALTSSSPRTPSAGPTSNCCEGGRPLVPDPLTGQFARLRTSPAIEPTTKKKEKMQIERAS